MRHKYYFILVLIILLSEKDLAQVSFDISNTMRYGNGERSLGNSKSQFKYFENLTDLRLNFPYNISVGARALYDNPPETGFAYKGLKRRFIEITDDNYHVRVGDFSQLYGRGLALNLFETRSLGYDTWMDGLKGKYSFNNFTFSGIAGKLNFRDSIEFKREENYTLYGGGIEFNPIRNLKIGFAYIHAEGEFLLIPQNITVKAEIPSVYFSYNSKNISFLMDYSYKNTTGITDKLNSDGRGLYSSLSYSESGLGITLDYKNYSYDERDPYERNDFTRITRMLPFQNPPIVIKEHSYTLLTRAIHEVDFNDELGFQLEAFLTPFENSFINLNASISSRHSWWKFSAADFRFIKTDVKNILPSFSSKYSPYYELFAEFEYSFEEHTSIKIAAAKRSKTFYDEFYDGKNNHVIHSTVIPLQLKHSINSWLAFETDYQVEFVNDNYNTAQPEFSNHLLNLITVISQNMTLGFRYEVSTNRVETSGRRVWPSYEVGWRINQNISAVVSYGKDRGGQICSKGVCRYILPFEGVRFLLLTNF
jgi:hypothetical protein